MSIQYNHQLNTHTAVDSFGVVIAIYNPATHGTLESFKASCADLVNEGG